MTVCERIDNILKERGMSRRKLAERAGIPPPPYNQPCLAILDYLLICCTPYQKCWKYQ